MWRPLLLLCVSLCFGACSDEAPPPDTAPAVDPTLLDLTWPDLIPAGGNPETLHDRVAKEQLFTPGNHDPFSQAVIDAAALVSPRAPLRTELNGRRVRLSGLVVPLEGDGTQMREFLLVPYVGACIHVPPPPGNQLIWVKSPRPVTAVDLYGPVQVVGRLKAEYLASDLGDAGYQLEAEQVAPVE